LSESLVNLLPPDLAKPKVSSSQFNANSTPVPASAVPKFGPPAHLMPDRFWSNFRDFLLERPVKLGPAREGTPFRPPAFRSGLLDNLKEFLQSKPVPAGRASGTGLEVNWGGNFGGFKERLKDALFGPKLRLPKGAKVKEIWTKDEDFGRTQAISMGAHGLLLLLLFLPLFFKTTTVVKAKTDGATALIEPWMPPGADQAHGGGGQHAKLPPEKGKLPRFAQQQIAAPTTIKDLHPKFAAEATLLGPDMKLPNPLANMGDPLASLNDGGLGNGEGTGIGSGTGGGYGPGSGGGTGGGIYNAGRNGVGTPVCYYQPEPQYSEEARKAKYQGTVLLQGVVTPDGRFTNLSVAKGLGMGLDENAIAAVKTWKCKPASGPSGKPVSVFITIEVGFHLL
jgi:protein TonB